MASWVLTCKNCREIFSYSHVGEKLFERKAINDALATLRVLNDFATLNWPLSIV